MTCAAGSTYTYDYYPFGGESVVTQNLANQHYKFEGKERDPESGLDNFGARFSSSNVGRFMSPDWANSPEPVPYSKLSSPQSLNLYAFAGNNPESAPDLDGHEADRPLKRIRDLKTRRPSKEMLSLKEVPKQKVRQLSQKRGHRLAEVLRQEPLRQPTVPGPNRILLPYRMIPMQIC